MSSEFGPFERFLSSGPASYLSLLHLASPLGAQAIARAIDTGSCSETHVLAMLSEPDWRPVLVGAVAAYFGFRSEQIISALWQALDSGVWVTPQVAVVLSEIDEHFVDHALSRVADTDRRPINPKAAAALFRLLETKDDPRIRDLRENTRLMETLAQDVDGGGSIAAAWQIKLLRVERTET